MAEIAGRVFAVFRKPGADGLRLLARRRGQIGFHTGRGRRRRRSDKLLQHPGAAQHGRGAVAVGSAQQHRALAEQPTAGVVLEGHAAELRAADGIDTVVFRQAFVQERVVGAQQLLHVAVFQQDAAQEQVDLCLDVGAQLRVELGEQLPVRLNFVEVVEVEPVECEDGHQGLGLRRGQHAHDLRLQHAWAAQLVGGCKFEQFVVRALAPEKEGQA